MSDEPVTRESLLADLRTLVDAIPEERQSEETGNASERLYEFVDQQAGQLGPYRHPSTFRV